MICCIWVTCCHALMQGHSMAFPRYDSGLRTVANGIQQAEHHEHGNVRGIRSTDMSYFRYLDHLDRHNNDGEDAPRVDTSTTRNSCMLQSSTLLAATRLQGCADTEPADYVHNQHTMAIMKTGIVLACVIVGGTTLKGTIRRWTKTSTRPVKCRACNMLMADMKHLEQHLEAPVHEWRTGHQAIEPCIKAWQHVTQMQQIIQSFRCRN